ncbi:unnamed protein product [Amoebophrya sp. A120]|nr:unnamed protein product [Amoebophrya sp. A120]|eukprot:GSA120T00020969001.1
MATYQILACHAGEQSKDSILSVLKSRVTNTCDEVCKFDVPDTLKFGSFDSLVKMMDDLSKYDSQVEGILRRIERQMTDLDANADFKVLFRQKTMTVESYVRSFQWDDTKWPRNRNVSDNMTSLMNTVSRIDDDVKNKAYAYADVKSSLASLNKSKGPGTTLMNAELTEILTPDVVAADDFIAKEHLTTVLVIVPRGGEKEFLESYERVDPFVVPRSAKQFQKLTDGKLLPIEDKDGNSLWRVVCFKKSVETVRKGLKECKCSIREFSYSVDAYKEFVLNAETLQFEFTKNEMGLKRHCAAAFSDTLVAWMHLKAMRVFVEAILRYGVPPNFASFIVRPTSAKNITKLRTVLNDVFSASGLFGQNYLGGSGATAEGAEEEAYYPYVSLSFSPLSVKEV